MAQDADANDPLTKEERSKHMSKIRSKGNRSTELRVEASLLEHRIVGWEKHKKDVLGKPDFYFPKYNLALFIDGCFWHGCPKCNRKIPHTRTEFWREKIDTNRRRDNRYHRKLRKQGYHVMRVWEHDLKKDTWVKRLLALIRRIDRVNK